MTFKGTEKTIIKLFDGGYLYKYLNLNDLEMSFKVNGKL